MLSFFDSTFTLVRTSFHPRAGTCVGVSALLILFLLGARTAARNRDWRDEVALWESAVTASPESAKAHKAHAAALFAADPQHRVLERVIAEAERAVAIRPDYLLALIDLGGYERDGSVAPLLYASAALLSLLAIVAVIRI